MPENDDLQLDFTMLFPFLRLPLTSAAKTVNSSVFETRLTIPDYHGIFSFRINYQRPFLSNIEVKEEVTIRHFAHDEYTRSWAISGAWVWIGGLWSVIAGFLAFVTVWLYSAPVDTGVSSVKKSQ